MVRSPGGSDVDGPRGGWAPSAKARLAGLFYAGNWVASIVSEFTRGKVSRTFLFLEAVTYTGVVVMLYVVIRIVGRKLAAIATVVGLVGCVMIAFESFHWRTTPGGGTRLIGIYWIILGYLMARSRFMPRILGVSFSLGGVLWAASSFRELRFGHWNALAGIPELALTIWLIAKGVRDDAWRAQAEHEGSVASQAR